MEVVEDEVVKMWVTEFGYLLVGIFFWKGFGTWISYLFIILDGYVLDLPPTQRMQWWQVLKV